MTQAFNLAQLANNLNTTGQLDATDGLNGLVANANLASSGSASSSTYLRGDRTWASLPALGKVLQVVNTFYTGTASTSSPTPANVSGFSATITPSSTSSRILIMTFITFGHANDAYPYALLTRNGTSIFTGAGATGSQINTYASGTGTSIASSTQWRYSPMTKINLDSPATTSALTYQIQLASPYNGYTGHINRQEATNNDSYIQFPGSSITLMEIGA